MPERSLAWRSRLASITTINAPHFGTPLASFFTTASGQRVLRTLSALTVIALTVGSPPLATVSALVAVFGNLDRTLGLELKVLDRATDAILEAFGRHPFIFNLGHGILPETPISHVERLIARVRNHV